MTNETKVSVDDTQHHRKRQKEQTGYTVHLADELRQKHAEGHSWRDVSVEFGVLTDEGKPNPGLAKMIADGYQPSTAVMARIFKKPVWVNQAVATLRKLEVAHPDTSHRVYNRNGQRVYLPKEIA